MGSQYVELVDVFSILSNSTGFSLHIVSLQIIENVDVDCIFGLCARGKLPAPGLRTHHADDLPALLPL